MFSFIPHNFTGQLFWGVVYSFQSFLGSCVLNQFVVFSMWDSIPIFLAVLGTVAGAALARFFSSSLGKSMIGTLVGVAAGMMLGCAFLLSQECVSKVGTFPGLVAISCGCLLMLCIDKTCSAILSRIGGEFNFSGLQGTNAVRVFVMMLSLVAHSIGEGLSLGVSSAADNKSPLVALSLALHNVPEAAALFFSYNSKGVSPKSSLTLAILSNLPQSLIALPALAFSSSGTLSYGMGLSSGCMLYAVVSDVFPEACGSLGKRTASSILGSSLGVILLIDSQIHSL